MSRQVNSASTSCYKCGQWIRASDNENSQDYWPGTVIDKLRHHWNHDVACLRGEKLKEVLGEVNDHTWNAQQHWEEKK